MIRYAMPDVASSKIPGKNFRCRDDAFSECEADQKCGAVYDPHKSSTRSHSLNFAAERFYLIKLNEHTCPERNEIFDKQERYYVLRSLEPCKNLEEIDEPRCKADFALLVGGIFVLMMVFSVSGCICWKLRKWCVKSEAFTDCCDEWREERKFKKVKRLVN